VRNNKSTLTASFIRRPLALAVGVGIGGQTISFEAGRVGVGWACFCGLGCVLGIWPYWREVALWGYKVMLWCSDTIRTRKRITAHSEALLFLGLRIARAALAHASAVVERAGIARAYSGK